MASFSYTGRKGGGELVQGAIEASNSSAAADQIFGLGVTPIEIREAAARQAPAASGAGLEGLFARKILPYDVMLFSRQMYTRLKAGVPVMRALTGLQDSAVNPAMKAVIQDVRTSLEAGRELSLSLARR